MDNDVLRFFVEFLSLFSDVLMVCRVCLMFVFVLNLDVVVVKEIVLLVVVN